MNLPNISSHRKGGIANLFSNSLLLTSGISSHQNEQRSANFLSFYETSTGALNQLLKDLLIDLTEQRAWLNIWLQIDPNRKNRMTFVEFCKVFKFDSKQEWSRRIFDMINIKLSGVVTFDEYLTFCWKYLILDIESLKEFTFRLLSRRAATCDTKTTVLDLQDMKFFLKFCYKIKKHNLDKVAMEIFTEMDNSGDFGVAISEFDTYSQRNQSFLAFGNCFLTHFRLCWFGYDFWLKRSQQVKKKRVGGFGAFIRLKTANVEAEEFIKMLMKRHGINPNNLRIAKKSSNVEGGGGGGGGEGGLLPSPISGLMGEGGGTKQSGSVLSRLSQLTKKKKNVEVPKVGIGPGGVISEEFYDEDDHHNTATVDGTKLEETDEQKAQRLSSLQFNEREFDYHRLTLLSFEKDFTDVLLTRKTLQQLKQENKLEKITTQLLKESQTYTLLTTVLDDLMHFRRGKRIAFMRWLKAVGMEGTVEVIYRTDSSIVKIEEKKKKGKDEPSDDGTGTWTEETGTGEGSAAGTGGVVGTGGGTGGGKPRQFLMTEEDEYKLHKRIMEMTKRIQENDADEEAYSEFMREYHSNTHKKWYNNSRINPIKATRNQLLIISQQQNNQEEEEENEDDDDGGHGNIGL